MHMLIPELAYVHATRQVRGTYASTFSNLAEPILDARLHNSYFLT